MTGKGIYQARGIDYLFFFPFSLSSRTLSRKYLSQPDSCVILMSEDHPESSGGLKEGKSSPILISLFLLQFV